MADCGKGAECCRKFSACCGKFSRPCHRPDRRSPDAAERRKSGSGDRGDRKSADSCPATFAKGPRSPTWASHPATRHLNFRPSFQNGFRKPNRARTRPCRRSSNPPPEPRSASIRTLPPPKVSFAHSRDVLGRQGLPNALSTHYSGEAEPRDQGGAGSLGTSPGSHFSDSESGESVGGEPELSAASPAVTGKFERMTRIAR